MSNFVRLEEFQVIGMYQLDTEFGGSKQHYSLLSYLKIHISSYTKIKPNKAVYSKLPTDIFVLMNRNCDVLMVLIGEKCTIKSKHFWWCAILSDTFVFYTNTHTHKKTTEQEVSKVQHQRGVEGRSVLSGHLKKGLQLQRILQNKNYILSLIRVLGLFVTLCYACQ